jgi:hypothetical protein
MWRFLANVTDPNDPKDKQNKAKDRKEEYKEYESKKRSQLRCIQHADILKRTYLCQVSDTGSSEPLV